MAGGLLALVLVTLATGPEGEAGPDPSGIVARLGSHQPAERAATVEALEKLGAEALPALRAARFGATDLVLRARAAAVLDAIEAQRLTHATMVRLDFRDRPLPEVLDALSTRTGMKLVLGFDPNPNRKPPSITLDAPEPVPFWTAVERLCTAGGLRQAPMGMAWQLQGMMAPAMPGQPPRRPLDGTELFFVYRVTVDGGAGAAAPTSDFGPFQLRLLSIHMVRDRSFVSFPQAGFLPCVPGQETERFDAQVQVWAEPRLSLVQVGEVSALDAKDDRGQSLRPDPVAPGPGIGQRPIPTFNGNGNGGRAGSLTIRLKYPETPGTSIARLAGRVQVTVAARKPDPLVISLADDLGHPFRDDTVTLVVHEVKTEPETKATIVELVMTTDTPRQAGGFPTNLDGRLGLGTPNTELTQLEFLDAQGRLCQAIQNGLSVSTEGMRRIFRINPVEGTGPPVQVRYHGLVWATLDVPFAFQDLPMP